MNNTNNNKQRIVIPYLIHITRREITEMNAINNIHIAMENAKLDYKTIVSDFK